MPIIPECLACGTCCFSRLATYVRVTGRDHARLGERADELVRFDGNRAYMRMVDDHCGALQIDPGSGRFVCGAYAIRPDVCRELARGSGACRGELETKAMRPLLELGRLRRELEPDRWRLADEPSSPASVPVSAQSPSARCGVCRPQSAPVDD